MCEHPSPVTARPTANPPLFGQGVAAQRAQARNRLRSVLHRLNRAPPAGDPFAVAQRAWWDGLELTPAERLRVRQDLTILDTLAALVAEAEAELARLSTAEPWAEQAAFLVQLPGVGVTTAMVLLAAIGGVTRFPSAKHLVGYSGLGASVHPSGQTRRTGGITKQIQAFGRPLDHREAPLLDHAAEHATACGLAAPHAPETRLLRFPDADENPGAPHDRASFLSAVRA